MTQPALLEAESGLPAHVHGAADPRFSCAVSTSQSCFPADHVSAAVRFRSMWMANPSSMSGPAGRIETVRCHGPPTPARWSFPRAKA